MIKGRISEVFDSIQGEGIYVGESQIFVRFFGCNLSCGFCDTKLKDFSEYAPNELFEEIKNYQGAYHSVAFTGGEPLLQKDFLKEVSLRTSLQGYRNYLETNGTLPGELEEVIDYMDIVAMDLKLPSSTVQDPMWREHKDFLKIASRKEVFLKAIICLSTTEEDLREALSLIKGSGVSAILVLQPNSFEHSVRMDRKLKRFKDICFKEGTIACVIPQAHKLIGVR